jgi:hypothetical protein
VIHSVNPIWFWTGGQEARLYGPTPKIKESSGQFMLDCRRPDRARILGGSVYATEHYRHNLSACIGLDADPGLEYQPLDFQPLAPSRQLCPKDQKICSVQPGSTFWQVAPCCSPIHLVLVPTLSMMRT